MSTIMYVPNLSQDFDHASFFPKHCPQDRLSCGQKIHPYEINLKFNNTKNVLTSNISTQSLFERDRRINDYYSSFFGSFFLVTTTSILLPSAFRC